MKKLLVMIGVATLTLTGCNSKTTETIREIPIENITNNTNEVSVIQKCYLSPKKVL